MEHEVARLEDNDGVGADQKKGYEKVTKRQVEQIVPKANPGSIHFPEKKARAKEKL